MKALVLALALAFAAGPAAAQSAGGHDALAFAVIVGGGSPLLSAHQKAVVAQLLGHRTPATPHTGKIVVKADAIVCRASNVDITAFACDLTFGAATRRLSGRPAHEMFATLGEVGVQPDGAAGTIYMAAHNVRCTLDLAAIAQNGGGGADCAYSPGPS